MSQRLNHMDLAPAGMAALSGVEHVLNTASCLPPVLLELVRLRASLLNGCEYCIGLHTHELHKHNEPDGRIAGVAAWRDSAAYTQQERAALRWTDVITNIQQGHAPDQEFAAVREHFTDAELVHLTLAISSINAWNRIAIAFRPQHTMQPQNPTADDGGKVSVDA